MKRTPPSLNFVRSFECAARHLSFTRAAEELGYTQAAISTHVRALEKYIGRPLFMRSARSLALTELGEAYLPTLRQALSQIDGATDAIAAGSRTQSVAIACPMSLAENWLPGQLESFRTVHPGVEVLVYGTVWDDTIAATADIVIAILREDEVPEGAVRLWDETLVLLAAPEIASRLRTPGDLAGIPRVLVSGRHEYWTLMCEAIGIVDGDEDVPLKTNASNISLELAAQGLGVVVTLSTLGEVYQQRGLLVEPFDVRARSPWSYYLIRQPQGHARAPKALVRHLMEARKP